MKLNVLGWFMVAVLMAGCVAAPVVIEKRDGTAPAVVEPAKEAPAPPASPAKPPRLFEDRELLLDGVKLLSLPDQPAPGKARSVFSSLGELYPQSRWRPVAEALIRLIDEGGALREATRQDLLLTDQLRAEKTRALQENDALRKAVRELTEKLQTETSHLMQENEQLKQDIQRLKALEIELQKRERKLR